MIVEPWVRLTDCLTLSTVNWLSNLEYCWLIVLPWVLLKSTLDPRSQTLRPAGETLTLIAVPSGSMTCEWDNVHCYRDSLFKAITYCLLQWNLVLIFTIRLNDHLEISSFIQSVDFGTRSKISILEEIHSDWLLISLCHSFTTFIDHNDIISWFDSHCTGANGAIIASTIKCVYLKIKIIQDEILNSSHLHVCLRK